MRSSWACNCEMQLVFIPSSCSRCRNSWSRSSWSRSNRCHNNHCCSSRCCIRRRTVGHQSLCRSHGLSAQSGPLGRGSQDLEDRQSRLKLCYVTKKTKNKELRVTAKVRGMITSFRVYQWKNVLMEKGKKLTGKKPVCRFFKQQRKTGQDKACLQILNKLCRLPSVSILYAQTTIKQPGYKRDSSVFHFRQPRNFNQF